MRVSRKLQCGWLAVLMLCQCIVAQPLLARRLALQHRHRERRQAPHNLSPFRQSPQQQVLLSEDAFGNQKVGGAREKRLVKTVAATIGSGLKAASVAGIQALGKASAGTVGLVGKASAGTVSALGAASLGAAGAASGAVAKGVGAASGLGFKAIGSASSLGLTGAKALTKVSLAGAKTVGAAGAKVAVKTGFAVAKAAVTVGIAKLILSLVFGKINQLIDWKSRLVQGLNVSNLSKHNSVLGVSSSSSSSSSSSGQQPSGHDEEDKDEEDLPDISPDSVSLQVPDAFFSKGFNVVNKASPIVGDVVQNTAERAAKFIQNLKPLLKSSLFGSSSARETTWNLENEDDVPIKEED